MVEWKNIFGKDRFKTSVFSNIHSLSGNNQRSVYFISQNGTSKEYSEYTELVTMYHNNFLYN